MSTIQSTSPNRRPGLGPFPFRVKKQFYRAVTKQMRPTLLSWQGAVSSWGIGVRVCGLDSVCDSYFQVRLLDSARQLGISLHDNEPLEPTHPLLASSSNSYRSLAVNRHRFISSCLSGFNFRSGCFRLQWKVPNMMHGGSFTLTVHGGFMTRRRQFQDPIHRLVCAIYRQLLLE